MSNVNNVSMLSFGNNTADVRLERLQAEKAVKATDAIPAEGTAPELTQPSKQQLQQAVDVVNQAAVIEQRSLSFSIDDLSGRSIIKVVDQQTDQLIRQIPTEELLKVAQDIKKLQEEMGQSLGLLIDRQV